MLIIGIDPGLATTGYGIVDFKNNSYSYVASGTIKTKPPEPLAKRLHTIHIKISEIIDTFKPTIGAIEQTYVNVSAESSLKLAHARAAAMLSMQINGLDVAEYQSKTIKKTLTGTGSADKSQMVQMINYFMPKINLTNPDAADALAIAICHGFYMR